MSPMQAFAFCAGAMGMALLVGGAIAESGALDPAFRRELAKAVLTEAALDERIELALVALAQPARRLGRKGVHP
jgi:hypothetical protein